MGKLHHKIASRHNSATLASPPRAGKRTRSLEPKSGCSILWPTPCALGAVDFTKGLQAAGPPWCDETQLLEAGESTLDKRPAEGKGKKKKKKSKHVGYLMLSITNLTGSLWKRLEFREPQTSPPLSLRAGQPIFSTQVAVLHIQDPPP